MFIKKADKAAHGYWCLALVWVLYPVYMVMAYQFEYSTSSKYLDTLIVLTNGNTYIIMGVLSVILLFILILMALSARFAFHDERDKAGQRQFGDEYLRFKQEQASKPFFHKLWQAMKS